jgi:hypothetical protein
MNCLRRAAAFALALQMRLLQSFASPACIGWSDIADQLWDAGRSPLLASLHFLASSFGTIGWLRSESPGLLIPVSLLQGIACSLAHGAAWGKLLGAKRRHTSNLLCCLAWVCRCSVGESYPYCWKTQSGQQFLTWALYLFLLGFANHALVVSDSAVLLLFAAALCRCTYAGHMGQIACSLSHTMGFAVAPCRWQRSL